MNNRRIFAMAAVLGLVLLAMIGCYKEPVINGGGDQTNEDVQTQEDVQTLPETSRGESPQETNSTDTDSQSTTPPTVTVQKHTVVFDYNDGSGQTMEVEVPHGSTIDSYAPTFSYADKEVRCWSSMLQGEGYVAPITGDITLYAQWTVFTPVIYTDSIPNTVNDRFVEIHTSGDITMLSDKVLRIGPKVERLTIIGDGSVYTNFAIVINERNSDIRILLDGFSYTSNEHVGLLGAGASEYCVHLTVENHCSIDCSEAVAGAEQSGSMCIQVPKLTIGGNGTLSLKGGHGRAGEDMPTAPKGEHGDDGGAGTSGGCGIVADYVYVEQITLEIVAGNGGAGGKGGNGKNGDLFNKNRNGGDGGKGGNGGVAISTSDFVTRNAALELTAGNGGVGGKGGNGSGYLNNAGNGGDGGNGGRGGDVFDSRIQNYENSGSTYDYQPGQGAVGGKGGSTKDGVDVLDGDKGAPGANGSVNVN